MSDPTPKERAIIAAEEMCKLANERFHLKQQLAEANKKLAEQQASIKVLEDALHKTTQAALMLSEFVRNHHLCGPKTNKLLDAVDIAIEHKENESSLPRSFDARVWADEFCSLFKVWNCDGVYPDKEAVELMTGWFANAIMCGYDNSPLSATSPSEALDKVVWEAKEDMRERCAYEVETMSQDCTRYEYVESIRRIEL